MKTARKYTRGDLYVLDPPHEEYHTVLVSTVIVNEMPETLIFGCTMNKLELRGSFKGSGGAQKALKNAGYIIK